MKTVKKALDILEVFLNGAKEIGISELAKITGQNVSTIHNILIDLSEKGYIRQQETRGKYSLGSKFLSFNVVVNRIASMVDTIKPLMTELCQSVNETVNLCINSGNYTVSIATIYSAHSLRVVPDEDVGVPLYSTGVGKVFLAARTDTEVTKYLKTQKLISYTNKTITDPKQIKRQIKKIRQEGIASDDEEHEVGIRNVAAPVRDASGEVVAVIGILGPSIRLSLHRMKELEPVLKQCATKISDLIRNSEDQSSGN